MPDIQMCPDHECPFSKRCRRHPDSGTIADKYHAWGFFEKTGKPDDPKNCNGWWPMNENSGVLDKAGLLRLLRSRYKNTTKCKAAKDLGISEQYLGDVLFGRREPGPKLLSALGAKKEIRYVITKT